MPKEMGILLVGDGNHSALEYVPIPGPVVLRGDAKQVAVVCTRSSTAGAGVGDESFDGLSHLPSGATRHSLSTARCCLRTRPAAALRQLSGLLLAVWSSSRSTPYCVRRRMIG
jgi:hypothetical protein